MAKNQRQHAPRDRKRNFMAPKPLRAPDPVHRLLGSSAPFGTRRPDAPQGPKKAGKAGPKAGKKRKKK